MTNRARAVPRGRPGPIGATGPSGPDIGRLGTVCETITDWNDATTNGYYMGFNILNAPVPSLWLMGHVIAHNANYVEQIIHVFTAPSTTDFKKYRRACDNGTWKPWVKIHTETMAHCVAPTGGGSTALVATNEFGFGAVWSNVGGFYLGTAIGVTGSRLHVPVDGAYSVSAKIYKTSTAAASIALRVNGSTTVSFLQAQASTAAGHENMLTTILDLNADDYLSFQCTDAVTLYLASQHTELNIQYLGQ